MNDSIFELRSAIRRLRPFLLLSKDTSSVSSPPNNATASSGIEFATAAAPAAVTTAAANTHDASSSLPEVGCEEEVDKNDVLRHELQEEAITELVESLASFIYDLDLFWAAAGNEEEQDGGDVVNNDDGGGGSKSSIHKQVVVVGRRQRSTATTNSNSAIRKGHSEPESEWNEEAKLLVREGYGLLLAAATTPTTNHYPLPPHQQQYPRELVDCYEDENDSMRCLVRNSILDLLPSLNTGPCRHFLLSFLPHFMPSASSWSGNKEDMDGCGTSSKNIPSWLHEDDNDIIGIAVDTNGNLMSAAFHHQQEEQSRSNSVANHDNDGVVVFGSQNNNLLLVNKLLEVFQALIETDISTLAPLLSILSTLFGKFNNSIKNSDDDDDDDVSQQRDSSQGNGPTSSDLARIECFRLCLSSMSSVSEHDLPSLLNSLLALVWTVEEGRLVIDTVRREWMSICSACNDDYDDVDVVIEERTVGREDEKFAVDHTRRFPHVDHSLVYIGDVIIQYILSGQMPGPRYVAQGFLHSLDSSLHHTATKDGTDMQAKLSSTPLTSLDVIVMIALYSHHNYQHMVESIIDSMTHHQFIALFELLHLLIQSWTPSGVRRRRQKSDRERTDSILYEPLASPLISILFYIMMVSSSSPSSCSTTLVGGILPFCSATTPFSTATDVDGLLCKATTTSSACCRVLSLLYLTVDPNRQEAIINSLLSMITDSFVLSTSLDFPRKKHQRRNQQCEQSSQTCNGMLFEAARTACRTLLIISNSNGSNTSNIRGIVLDRLLLLASKSVLKMNFTEKLHAGNDATAYYHLFDMNCALVISLMQSSDEDGESNISHADRNESSEILILCQKLLFSSNLVSTATSNSSNSYQHRAICGMILASRLLRCKLIPISDRGNIWSWIIAVISPSSSAATPLDALDPEVARWGLTLLQFASSVIPNNCRTNFPEMIRFVETQPVCGQGDVFNQVNKMLATAGIIQWEDSLKVTLFLKETPHTFLAFMDASMYDQLRKQKSPTATSMVICGPHFLRGRLSQIEWLHKSNANQDKSFHVSIDLVSDYVYHLIDRYLELGTLQSANWNPRGWLLAKTQLPCCLTESAMEILGMKRHYSLELCHPEEIDDEIVYHRGVRDNDFQKQWRLLFADETRPKVTVVRNLVEFVYSLIISISVSSAALKHAHLHFQQNEMCDSSQSLLDSNTHEIKSMQRRKRKQVEALRKLLQFQVSKILSMQKICKNIHLALSGLANSVQQTKNRASGIYPKNNITARDSATANTVVDTSRQCEEKVVHERRRIPLSDLKSIISAIDMFMSSKANGIDDTILWTCLDDDIDDEALVKDMQSHSPRVSAQEENSSHCPRISMILRLRRSILECLLKNVLQMNSKSSSASLMMPFELTRPRQYSVSLRGISRLFRMTISLLDIHVISNGVHGNAIVALLSTHYKLLLAVFSIATKNTPTISALKCNVFRRMGYKQSEESFSSSGSNLWLMDVIQCCASISSANFRTATKEGISSSTHSNSTETLSEIFVHHLNDCKDASISCYVIDLVSILLLNNEWSRGTLAKITQGALYSVYTMSDGKVKNPPYTLIKLNSILIDVSTDEEECFDSVRASFVNETFTNLIQTSKALLKAKDSFTSCFIHRILAHWSALILDGTSCLQFHSELVEAIDSLFSRRSTQPSNLSPRKRGILTGLNEKSHASLFELLLLMTNASLSLSKPRRVKKRVSSTYDFAETSPYGEIIGFMEVYGKLLLMFQSNRINFPRHFICTIVRSSSQTIRISDYQLRQCVQWRNSQPSHFTIGMDCAAVELLQPLVESVASHCIGCIVSFCNTMKVQQNGRKKTFDSSYKDTKAVAGLQYRCEGIKETLQGICQSQKLTLPKDFSSTRVTTAMNILSDIDSSVAKKKQRVHKDFSPQRSTRSRGALNMALTLPSVLELLPDTDVTMDMINASITRESNLHEDSEDSELNNVESEIENDSIHDSDDDNVDDDDSFGVIGNWGAD